MKHLENFKLNEDNSEEITVRVKDIIEYLETNFDPDAAVYLDKDGWDYDVINPKNVQDLIMRRGIFQKYKEYLFIQN